MCCCDCILVLIALIFPPFPVWIKCGICSAESFINVALCFLGYLPGVIHSFYIIAKYPVRYVVLDEEAQIYRVVPDRNGSRQYTRTVITETHSSGSSGSHQLNSSVAQTYGSTNDQPPPYTPIPGSSSNITPEPQQQRPQSSKN